MILILEIILTINAWNKGWRWWALLPVAIVFGVAYIIGAVIGASGGTIENPLSFIIFDILLIIVQIALICMPKKISVSDNVKPHICSENA